MSPRRRLLWIALALIVVSDVMAFVGIGKGAHEVVHQYLRVGNPALSSALLAAAVIYAATAPPARRNVVLGLGVVLEVVLALAHPSAAFANIGGGFGIVAIAGAAFEAISTTGPEPRSRFAETVLFPAFVVAASLPLDLTVLLHPYSLDARLLALDGALFDGEPAFAVGRVLASSPVLHLLAWAFYVEVPVLAAVVYLVERRAGRSEDVQIAVVLTGLVGAVLYHFAPAAGPSCWALFPAKVPALDRAFAAVLEADTHFRNSLPSLHVAWLLLLWWHARDLSLPIRVAVAGWLALTIVAMLGLGEGYLVDVLVTVPFAVAMRAALATRLSLRSSPRSGALAAGVASYALWVVALHASRATLEDAALMRPLSIATAGVPLLLERRLRRAELTAPEREPLPPAERVATTARARIIGAIFFASGFAGLVYEVVFAKSLALVFGSTAVASTTVLATYMGGMALGSYVGGRVKTRSALRTYGLCELGVAIACALSPVIMSAIKSGYVAIAAGGDPGRPWIVALQVALGALVLLPPTVLMGMTLPILSGYFDREDPTLGRSVALLYGANTAGAACGALIAGYVLLPVLGVLRSTFVGVVLNLAVAIVAMRLATTPLPATAPEAAADSAEPPAEPPAVRWLGLASLGLGGLVSLGLEVTYTHLLAVVVGNSTFAFSSMLVAFLIGLSGGAAVGRRWLRARFSVVTGIGVAQALLVAAVLAGVFAWNAVPSYFDQYDEFEVARTFAITELARFVVCACQLIPPALCIGFAYPIAIEAVVRGSVGSRIRALGMSAATNTVGNIVGSLVTGFALIPHLGSLGTLHALTAITFVIAAGALALTPHRLVTGGAVALALLLAIVQPRSFDLSELSSGTNVYFHREDHDPVIDVAESLEGGMTTVTEGPRDDGTRVKTLYTNGKFQGNDERVTEMRAQYGFTLLPLLHTTERGEALVIGFGTGTSARAVRDAGFAHVRIVELSRDIVDLATRHFGSVNGHVTSEPNVAVSYTDGRNFLMLDPTSFDFIGIEISSIWFAGAASLYNVEFYDLAKRRLTDHGVLQQWVQLHHVDESDIASMVASLRAVFRYVWFYKAAYQGLLVACARECPSTPEAVAKIDASAGLREGLALFGNTAASLLSERVFSPAETDRFVELTGATVSTDDNSFLEYHTPRGNVRDRDLSSQENDAFLRRFSDSFE